jgi:hypothetical protein
MAAMVRFSHGWEHADEIEGMSLRRCWRDRLVGCHTSPRSYHLNLRIAPCVAIFEPSNSGAPEPLILG